MAVLFDARSASASRTTGWERYVRELSSRLATQDDVRVVTSDVEPVTLRIATDVQMAIRAAREQMPIHYPTYPPLWAKNEFALTVHDLTWWTFPETSSRLGKAYYRPLLERAIPRAGLICTHSESVRAEVVDYFGVDEGRVVTVSCGAGALRGVTPEAIDSLAKPFILAVGTLEPRKNLLALVNAYLATGLSDVDLVIAGRAGWGAVPEGVVVLTETSDSQLRWLYENCLGLVAPSLYEGFGLPLVEAGSFGKPVACSDIPVFREVLADALYFDPHSPQEIQNALRMLAAGSVQPPDPASIEVFTWDAVADRVRAAYRARGWVDGV